jgi:hypothetical protein
MIVNGVMPAMKENKYLKRSPDSGKLQGRSIVFLFKSFNSSANILTKMSQFSYDSRLTNNFFLTKDYFNKQLFKQWTVK